MALIKCPECGKVVSDKSNVCIHCGCPLNTEATMTQKEEVKKVIPNDNKDKKLNKGNKLILILVSSVVSTVVLGMCVGIPVGNKIYRDNLNKKYATLYSQIEYEAMHFDQTSPYIIRENLEQLPKDYKNANKYDEEFTRIWFSTTKLNGYVHDNTDGRDARNAFTKLVSLDHYFENWDLSNFLNSGEAIKCFMFGVNWTCNDLIFHWREEDGSFWVNSNIPNDKNPNYNYYYDYNYVDGGLEFGYNNSYESFSSYLFFGPSYKNGTYHIKCHCYKDNNIYDFSF